MVGETNLAPFKLYDDACDAQGFVAEEFPLVCDSKCDKTWAASDTKDNMIRAAKTKFATGFTLNSNGDACPVCVDDQRCFTKSAISIFLPDVDTSKTEITTACFSCDDLTAGCFDPADHGITIGAVDVSISCDDMAKVMAMFDVFKELEVGNPVTDAAKLAAQNLLARELPKICSPCNDFALAVNHASTMAIVWAAVFTIVATIV